MQICDKCYSPIESGGECDNCSPTALDYASEKTKTRLKPITLISAASVVAVLSAGIFVFSLGEDTNPQTDSVSSSDPSDQNNQPEVVPDPEPAEARSHDQEVELSPGKEFSVIFDNETAETMPRWDPCKSYSYAINKGSFEVDEYIVRDGFEVNDGDLLRESFKRAQELSGLRFLYLSKTADNYEQNKAYETNLGVAEVLVQYLREDDYLVAASESGISTSIAFAGPLSQGIVGETGYLVAGRIVINADEIDRLLDDGREEVISTAYLHEIGHLIGLGHVENPDALMFGGNSYFSSFTEGDRLGFEWAGEGPCEN